MTRYFPCQAWEKSYAVVMKSTFTFVAICLLLFTGCSTLKEGVAEPVSIRSVPEGAEVWLDGAYVGQTPLAVPLSRKFSHEVRLEKSGYRTEVRSIAPMRTSGNGFVRFGLMEDSGLYHHLSPNPLMVNLRPEIVPESTGVDSFQELGKRIVQVDADLAAGKISESEHAYIVEQLLQFYSR